MNPNTVQVVVDNQYVGSVFCYSDVWFAETPDGLGMTFLTKQQACEELFYRAAETGNIEFLNVA